MTYKPPDRHLNNEKIGHYQQFMRQLLPFFLMCLFCFFLSLIRAVKTQTITFLFLNWNLFLAAIPLMISTYALAKTPHEARPRMSYLAFFIWLIFLPNAPYILTDLFHFRVRDTSLPWFDLGVIHCFALTGLIMGIRSVRDVELILRSKFKPRTTQLTIISLLFLCSFGIYIGRFLRWNSWDIFLNPGAILADIAGRFLHPLDHPGIWGMTVLFGILLNMVYWSLKLMPNVTESE